MSFIKRMLNSESGFILPTALVLLIMGGFLVVPSLYLLQTSLNSGQVVDTKTLGIYAADAGIEDALWKYTKEVDPFASGNSYNLAENINGMAVTLEKLATEQQGGGTLYTIKSTARLNGQVKAEIIAKPLVGMNLSWMFDHALTSDGNINIQPGCEVVGGVLYEGSLDNKGSIIGPQDHQTVSWPTQAQLTAFYWDQVKNLTPYPSSSINISSGTQANPYGIGTGPPAGLYRNGSLSISGSGYGRLNGTVYVKGDFSVAGGSALYLNGQTVFAEGAINFATHSTVYGPGCLIAVGSVNFQPNMAPGDKLIGVDDTLAQTSSAPGDYFRLSRFQAVKSGSITSFHINCSGPGNVKVAMYADSTGPAPGALLKSIDTSEAVVDGWNTINFPATSITSGTYYWLAANADAAIIGTGSQSSIKKYKPATYSSFTFPNPAGSGFTTENNSTQYLFSGWSGSQEFIFVMSLTSTANIQPGGTFYGSIAGDANVNLQPHCAVTLVGLPDSGLNFPGTTGGGGGGSSGLQLRTYSVQ